MKKRILALLMAVTMTLGMSMTAMAADYQIVGPIVGEPVSATEHVLTIENVTSGSTVKAYQIFDFDVNESGEINVAWGNGISDEGKSTLYQLFNLDGDNQSAYGVASAFRLQFDEAGNTTAPTAQEIKVFTDSVSGNTSGDCVSASEKDNRVSLNLPEGYYLIEEEVAEEKTYSLQLIIADKTVLTKTGDVVSEKKVDDVNDSDHNSPNDNLTYVDSADYDIGDSVPFTLLGTIPAYFDSHDKSKNYYYAFVDTMEPGLSFEKDSLVVYMVDSTVTDFSKAGLDKDGWHEIPSENYSVDVINDQNFSVEFGNLHAVEGIDSTKKLVVKFTSVLNSWANIGAEGNKNTSFNRYTNKNGGESETPKDTVIVFTYEVIVNKVDEARNPLAGAGFTLYKKVADKKTEGAISGSDIFKDGAHADDMYVKVGEIEASVTRTTFEFKGIDDGEYVLVESVTPAGYNTMAPVEFTVIASHENDTDPNPLVLDSVSILGADGLSDTTFQSKETNGTDGIFTKAIENRKGSLLPSTGGIGTTIFYIVGGILVIGAGVVLFTKKKMAVEEK